MKKRASYIWVIFYVDTKNYMGIKSELKSKGYNNIRVVVPTVRILKKRRKGKDVYEDVPLLFNYGFIRMPSELAYNRQFLRKLRNEITGIHSWLRSLEGMHEKKKKKRVDNPDIHDDFSMVAVVTWEEVKHFKRLSKNNQIYSKQDIVNLKIGDYITLRGYPFEGMNAEIQEVNPTTNKLKVILYPSNNGSKIVSVISYENALYSIYHNYSESLKCNRYEMDSSIITEKSINDNFSLKQY